MTNVAQVFAKAMFVASPQQALGGQTVLSAVTVMAFAPNAR